MLNQTTKTAFSTSRTPAKSFTEALHKMQENKHVKFSSSNLYFCNARKLLLILAGNALGFYLASKNRVNAPTTCLITSSYHPLYKNHGQAVDLVNDKLVHLQFRQGRSTRLGSGKILLI